MAAEEDSLASLEDRIRRTVDLVTALRTERDELAGELEAIRKATGSSLAEAERLRQEVEQLREERKQVLARIEKLLGQIDLVSGS